MAMSLAVRANLSRAQKRSLTFLDSATRLPHRPHKARVLPMRTALLVLLLAGCGPASSSKRTPTPSSSRPGVVFHGAPAPYVIAGLAYATVGRPVVHNDCFGGDEEGPGRPITSTIARLCDGPIIRAWHTTSQQDRSVCRGLQRLRYTLEN